MRTIPPGTLLARLDALPDASATPVRIDETDTFCSVVVTRKGDAIAAFRNICPHANYPLQRGDGRIVVQEGAFLVCAGHGASFALDTGACAGGPCNGEGLERVAIVIRDGVVLTA